MDRPFVYLDNAATTRVSPEVADVMTRSMTQGFGNPSSAHHLGVDAERALSRARAQLAQAIGDPTGDYGQIIWTSGGTESDALGLIGAARAAPKSQSDVVISALEHPAVSASAGLLANEGFKVSHVPANSEGTLSTSALREAMTPTTSVLAVMSVQNELGTVLPVAHLADAARRIAPHVHVHCDAVQALGKIPVDVTALGADSVAFAAHKLHGPKGVGALWLRHGRSLKALWSGGGQQKGQRSGTQNVPGIAGMGAAAEIAIKTIQERSRRYQDFSDVLVGACESAKLRFIQHCKGGERAGHIVSLGFEDCPAEPMLHTLESRGILCSAGSACSEKKRKSSAVLKAIAAPENFGTLRFSFGFETTHEEINRTAEVLVDVVRQFQS